MTTVIDASSYKVSDEFPPNKESTWTYPANESGWVHSHNALREEMKQLQQAFQAIRSRGGVKAKELKLLKSVWRVHEEHVHAHHTNEDDIFVPFLKTRFQYPEKAEADHEELVKKLNIVAELVNNLEEKNQIDEVLVALEAYIAVMIPHLEQEETECLPLSRAYFTPEEVGRKIQEIIAHEPKLALGSLISAMGVEHFRNSFMKQEGIPFFVWYIVFTWRIRAFRKEFVEPVELLKNGGAC
eukprot:Nitzschia sp. Nitz4//scaffold13_size275219//12266//12988//NITZ4_000835-RA/size275219-processed-gene-0.71-mRNA-1//1//CDS//3329535897//9029//frame0